MTQKCFSASEEGMHDSQKNFFVIYDYYALRKAGMLGKVEGIILIIFYSEIFKQ